MKKKIILFLLACLILLEPIGLVPVLAANPISTSAEENVTGGKIEPRELRITVMSDIHVLPENMIAANKDFYKAMQADRKLFVQSQGLFDSALELAERNQSQVIFIPGDLTKDGEYYAHEYVADKLREIKKRNPNFQYFLVPGNHDLNNNHALDFTKLDENGNALLSKKTDPAEYIQIYRDLYSQALALYKDSYEYNSYRAALGNPEFAQGSLSYASRVDMDKNNPGKYGLTVIGLDTTICTPDVNPKGVYEQITGGVMTQALYDWTERQVKEAHARGDVVMLMAHHGFIPHFEKQPEFLAPYLINNWNQAFDNGKTPMEAFADLGVKFIFTGHMHAQDISKFDAGKGKVFYDIQTGSRVTYPTPVRHMTLRTDYGGQDPNYSLDVRTELIKKVSYRDEFGKQQYVDDIATISKQNLITPDLLVGLANPLFSTDLYRNLEANFSATTAYMLDKSGNSKSLGECVWNLLPGLYAKNMESINKKLGDEGLTIKPDFEAERIDIEINTEQFTGNSHINKDEFVAFIEDLADQFQAKLQDRSRMRGHIAKVASAFMEAQLTEEVTMNELVNYAYLSHLHGDESPSPAMQAAIKKLTDGNFMDIVVQLKPAMTPVIMELLDMKYPYPPSQLFHDEAFEETIRAMVDNKIGTSGILDSFARTNFNTDILFAAMVQNEELSQLIEGKVGPFLTEIIVSMASESGPGYAQYAYPQDNNSYFKFRFTGPAPEVDKPAKVEKEIHADYTKAYLDFIIFGGGDSGETLRPKTAEIVKGELETRLVIGEKNLSKTLEGLTNDIKMDVAPFIVEGRTMVPIRFVAEALGFEVEWIGETSTVILKDHKNRVEIPIKTNKIIVNGLEFESDVAPILENDRTFIALANVARALGLKDGKEVIWIPESQEVIIKRSIEK